MSSLTAIDNRRDFTATFTNEYDNDQTAATLITPTSGKLLKVTGVYISSEGASASDKKIRLHFSTSDNTVATLYPFTSGALDFDGTDDYIVIGDHADFSFGDGAADSAFSISVWIKADDITNFDIINKYQTNREWRLWIQINDILYGSLYDESEDTYIGRYYNTALTSYEGKWTHIAMTYDATEASSGIKLYLNGVNVDDNDYENGAYTAMEALDKDVWIGRGTTGYADGQIDDVRIYGSELSAADVAKLYNNQSITSTPVSQWEMNDNANSATVTDAQGSHNGTFTDVGGTATTLAHHRDGRFNNISTLKMKNILVRGARNEVLKITSDLGKDKNYYIAVNYKEE